MKKLVMVLFLTVATLASTFAEARGGSFGGGRSSFSSSRSFSSPRYTSPRPIVNRPVINKTTVVQQHTTVVHQQPSSSGPGFFTGLIAGGMGGYLLGDHSSNTPSPAQQQPQVQPQYPLCPNPIPAGWNTPCIPAQTGAK